MVSYEQMLQPFEGEAPVGVDARDDPAYDSPYIQLKDARSEARDIERQYGVADPADIRAEAMGSWRTILKVSEKLLSETTKDLEIACWHLEARLRIDGIPGLTSGFEFLNELVTAFWDDGLFPAEDEDGIETRVAPLTALNGLDGRGTLIQPIKMAPLTGDQEPGPVAFWQYEQALALSKSTDAGNVDEQISEGAYSLDMVRRAFTQTPGPALQSMYNSIGAASDAYRALNAVMADKAGEEAPPSSNITDLLDELQRAMRSFAPHLGEVAGEDEGGAEVDGEGASDAAGGTSKNAKGAVETREDALRKLSEIADFFERTEPTSIIPLTLRDLVRRSRLPITELLQELLHDDPAARDILLQRAGIRHTQEE